MSSCNFHVVLYLYSCIRCHSHTPVGLCCYESSMRPHKVFLATSCQLYLRHHCQLDSSSHRTTCGITADLNRRLVGRLVASSPSWLIFIVASLPLPHSWGIMLLWKQYETIQGLSCGIMPTLIAASCRLYLRHHCRLDSSSLRTTCGITAYLNRRLVGRLAASSPSWLIFIVASLPLPHSCGNILLRKQYETELVLVAASLPTCG
jgi:hypothetical protein